MSFYSRFKSSKFLKLRYAVALGLFIAVSSGFASLADEVREGDTLPADRFILTSIHENLSTPGLDAAVKIGTNAGGVPFLVSVTILLVGLLVFIKAYSKALFLGLVMAGTGAANIVLKLFFERQRPDLWQQIVHESTFSFPSGHAMGSMAIGLTIILLAWHTRFRVPALLLGVTYVLFIGFSRLYLGVHYPTDIAAGWILAAGWVSLLYIMLRINGRRSGVTGKVNQAVPDKEVS